MTAVKNVLLAHIRKETDKSIEHVKGTGVKGSVHARRADEFNVLPKKPTSEEESLVTHERSGVEKGDATSTAVDKNSMASLISGVSCSAAVKCSDTTFDAPKPSRTADPLPPEHDEESGERSVTYYLPITFKEERS